MKKVLIIILFLLFAVGIYFNFIHTGPVVTNDTAENSAEETESGSEETEEQNQDEEDTASEDTDPVEEPADNSAGLAFNDPSIQTRYDEHINNNEPLIIDILLPDHYSDDFTARLSEQFGSDTVQFNQIDFPANTVTMNEITVNENSDIVMIDALQISDYNDEVLPERNLSYLTEAYLNLYNENKTVMILGNPNVHEHENLAATLSGDAEFFSNNDYFYIDNQELITESPYDYDQDQINPELEDEMINNITNYLLQ